MKKGDEVLCEVEWPNGRVTQAEGKLICVKGDEAYVYVENVGPVAVKLSTVEPA